MEEIPCEKVNIQYYVHKYISGEMDPGGTHPTRDWIYYFNGYLRLMLNIRSGGSRISQTGGANPWILDKNLLLNKIFAENCMKIKENLDRGGVHP